MRQMRRAREIMGFDIRFANAAEQSPASSHAEQSASEKSVISVTGVAMHDEDSEIDCAAEFGERASSTRPGPGGRHSFIQYARSDFAMLNGEKWREWGLPMMKGAKLGVGGGGS